MPMYKLCVATLAHGTTAGSIHEASEYAAITAWEAELGYFPNVAWLNGALNNASIAGEEKAAYELCSHGYNDAKAAMERTWKKLDRVWMRLPECCCLDLGHKYRAALRGMGACRDRLAKLPDLQLFGVAEDSDMTMVAYLLGRLIGIM